MITFLAYSAWLFYALLVIGLAKSDGRFDKFSLYAAELTWPEAVQEMGRDVVFVTGVLAVTAISIYICIELFPDFRRMSTTLQIGKNQLLEWAVVDIALLGWTSFIIRFVSRSMFGTSPDSRIQSQVKRLVSFDVVVAILSIVASILTIVSVLVQRAK